MHDSSAGLACDLHVHSVFSGPNHLPVLRRLGKECYSDPWEVYDAAKARGMDLVTLTDHDSIAGAVGLSGKRDVFVSEEVTCSVPGGRSVHLGVYDITEGQHERIARLRSDAEALFAYLAEEGVPAALNHPFSATTGLREVEDLALALGRVGLVETCNSMMPASTNAFARLAAEAAGLGTVGGSDAHTVASVAEAWTVVPGAATRAEFLAGLRRGFAIPHGRSGSYRHLTADVARVFAGGCAAHAAEAVGGRASVVHALGLLWLLPLLPLVPVVTAAFWADEVLFGVRHFRRFEVAVRRGLGRTPGSGALAAA